MRNVMIFSGGAYPGIEIHSCLRDSLVFHPIMGSSYSDHSRFVSGDYIDTLPFTYESDFAEKLDVILRERNIEFIIPTHDTIAMVLMENQNKLSARVVCSPLKTAQICRSKKKTYQALEGCDFLPQVITTMTTDIEYPLFVKPDEGQGSVGVYKVENEEELNKALDDSNSVICEYLPGNEYTIDCFTDRNGQLLFMNTRRRARVQYGISARAESVTDESAFADIANEINHKIKFRGYWFIQLKRDKNGKLKLMELCTRFSGTFNHSQGYGVNLPLLALCDFDGQDISVVKNKYRVTTDKTFIDRYELKMNYDRVYVDYDDTITTKNGRKSNPFVIAYLYQCKNKGVEIVMLTRHAVSKDSTLADDMKRLAISEDLFDEIVEMRWDEEKVQYMNTDKASIFVDNSFAERKKTSEQLNIPVFGVEHIGCLFDWRD